MDYVTKKKGESVNILSAALDSLSNWNFEIKVTKKNLTIFAQHYLFKKKLFICGIPHTKNSDV